MGAGGARPGRAGPGGAWRGEAGRVCGSVEMNCLWKNNKVRRRRAPSLYFTNFALLVQKRSWGSE